MCFRRPEVPTSYSDFARCILKLFPSYGEQKDETPDGEVMADLSINPGH